MRISLAERVVGCPLGDRAISIKLFMAIQLYLLGHLALGHLAPVLPC